MSDLTVIADVSDTLAAVLTTGLNMIGSSAVVQDLQDSTGSAPTGAYLAIFLFEVSEDPTSRNRPRTMVSNATNVSLQKPPMALLLKYLITPRGTDNLATQQRVLGRAMQVLYDSPILSGNDLSGNLSRTNDAIKVTLAPLNLEERTRVWHSIQKPYRLSVSYEVRVVNLDSQSVENIHPVARRSENYAISGNSL